MIKRVLLSSRQIVGCVLFFIATMFVAAFLTTIFAKDHIKRYASDYISERIRPAVDKSADIAEIALESPVAVKYLKPEHIAALKLEIANYRNDPQGYIKSVTATEESERQLISDAAASKAEVAALTEKIAGWKRSIHRHFNRVYRNILKDLRIFCATNIVGFVAAGILLWRAQCWQSRHVLPAGLLSIALAYSAFGYIDQNWFLSMLLNSFMGVWYPICVAVIFGDLLYQQYRQNPPAQNADNHSHEVQKDVHHTL